MGNLNCPKCEHPISAKNKFCANCGFELSTEGVGKRKTPPIFSPKHSTRGLWFAAILVIVVLVVSGTVITYFVVSSLGLNSWETYSESKPSQKNATPASSAVASSENTTLMALPSTATANDYIALKKGLTVWQNDGAIAFACTLENISDVVCVGAGVEVALYDAAFNIIGTSSSWVYRDIQPGEILELSFESENAQSAIAFCLTEIGGKPIDAQHDANSKAPTTSSGAQSDAQVKAPTPSEGDVPLVHGLTLLDGVVEKVQGGYLQGRIRNDSGETYKSVFINFLIYDSEGNQIDTSITSTSDFSPGVTWKFSAPLLVSPKQAVGYKISSIDVY